MISGKTFFKNGNRSYGNTKLPRRGQLLNSPRNRTFFIHSLALKISAPGLDGIPYSAWRLSPEDSYCITGRGLDTQGKRTADYFRPLGMPNTCDRLVDGTIAAVVMKATCAYMHPSQVQFKSPAADAVCVSSFKLDILRT